VLDAVQAAESVIRDQTEQLERFRRALLQNLLTGRVTLREGEVA
jgi:hypothetical protein